MSQSVQADMKQQRSTPRATASELKDISQSFKKLASDRRANVIKGATAQKILLGWSDLLDENDDPLTYSVDNAKQLLCDLPDFYQEVLDFAANTENFV